jgi:localization factor PodJL
MKFGVPWSSKGIRPEARETAKEAARRAGMSVDDWLNAVILQQAAQMGVSNAPQLPGAGPQFAQVQQRLDNLTQRIEQFTRTGPVAYAPQQYRNAVAGRAMAQPAPVAPPPRGSLDRAVAEIAARQRALNGAPAQTRRRPGHARAAAAAMPALPTLPPVPAPVPAQDLSGLEDQLRRITDQIETLRRPGVEEAINALRGELAEIGQTINEAMPRQAIDTIERQIQGLNQRIAEGRQNGVDTGALAGIEHGLAEVRDALLHLTPAESLVGFNDAVAGLEQKIDLIVGQNDPATLQQLEHAVTTLRGMAAHVASNEAVGALAAEVQALAEKIDYIAAGSGAGDALGHLEQRIDALSHALAERAEAGNTVPPQLEALVQSLADKLEQIQLTRGNDDVVVSHLEDRIVKLVEKLDASDSRLAHLEAIERGLADLLVHIEEMRAGRGADTAVAGNPAVDVLKQDIARTNDALDAVHGTLGIVVDRLATIEQDMRSGRSAPAPAFHDDGEPLELTQPIGKLAVRMVPDMPDAVSPDAPLELPPEDLPPLQPQALPAPHELPPPPAAADAGKSAAPRRLPPAAQLPINPDLPPDQPLEPGSGPPQMRANAGARIAASEAALGGVGAGAAPGSKSSFIAAARRAAQAAMQTEPRSAPPESVELDFDEGSSLRDRMMKRVKSLFIAASVIAVVVGSAQIVSNVFLADDPSPAGKTAQHADARTKTRAPAAPRAVAQAPAEPAPEPAVTQRTAQAASSYNFPAPLTPYPLNTLPPAPAAVSTAPAKPTAAPTTVAALPPSDPRDISPASPDITGTIPNAPPPHTATPDSQERLPAGIGGPALRKAALAGDPAAAYQVGLRFAEGRGVPVNLAEAVRWFERAASKGLAPAQFRYASMLEKGLGVRKDLGRARRLYLAAAGQGNAKAMHNLAVLYAEGVDGRPDYGTAAKWFSKAAEHGVADSQYNLGILYARGIGVTKSPPESYKWFTLAAIHGDQEAARKRDDIASGMDPRELAAARRAVETFKPAPQPEQATSVPEPPGGWDRGIGKTTPKVRSQSGPLSLGALTAGKR